MDFEYILDEINHYDVLDHYEDILWPDRNYRLSKTYIRDVKNPFEMDTVKFKKRYRFQQDSVLYKTSLIKSDLDNRGLPIAPEAAVLLSLRFYATESFQVVGDLYDVFYAHFTFRFVN